MPTLTSVADHLWQSTVFAAAVAVLVLFFKGLPARIRYRLWLAASTKFLLPFALLVSLGNWIASFAPQSTPVVEFSAPLTQAAEPFSEFQIVQTPVAPAQVPSWPSRNAYALLSWLWFAGFTGTLVIWAARWMGLRRILTAATQTPSDRLQEAFRRVLDSRFSGHSEVRLLSSTSTFEPGVLGIRRPVLLIPAGIEDRLTDAEMAAIMTHELCHIRRRDNLLAAIHMWVQSIFWFHPLVWWIGGRLVDERERACDDEVLRLGNDAETYAHGILTVCRFYLRSSLPWASGITSSNLKVRIEEIVSRQRRKLTMGVAAILVGLACSAVAVPIVIGMVHTVGLPAQTPLPDLAFETASVKRNVSGDIQASSRRYPGGRYTATNSTLHDLILRAYGLPDYLVSGGPGWWNTERYDIEAKAPAGLISDGPIDQTSARQFEAMQQRLLAERFKLRVHRETKVAPIYTMVLTKGGLKIQPPPTRDCMKPEEFCHVIFGGPRLLHGHTMSIAEIADMLGTFYLDRPVRDKTGIEGLYDFELHWTPESMRGKAEEERAPDVQRREPGVIDPFGPDLITALQEQLGLKLEAQRGPVESIVIDHVEKLVENEAMEATQSQQAAVVQSSVRRLEQEIRTTQGASSQLPASDTVEGITVTGLRRIPIDTIMSVIQLKPGAVLTSEAVASDVRAIYSLGYFDDVVVHVNDGPKGRKVVIFDVKEKPINAAGDRDGLPSSATSPASLQTTTEHAEKIIVMIDKDQRLLLQGNPVNVNELGLKILERLPDGPSGRNIYLQADESVPFGIVATVMDHLKTAGIENISIITDPNPKPKRP